MTNTIANNLLAHRKQAGLLQTDVAKALDLVSTDRISHWERGSAMPSVINLFKLAKLYGVRSEELYRDLFFGSETSLDNRFKDERLLP